MDVTIGFENESGAKLDPHDSQLYMCDESDASEEEDEANNVLNELNDLILNIKKKEELGDVEDLSGVGSVDNDSSFDPMPLPRTSSMVDEEEGSIKRIEDFNDDSKNNISGFEITPFELQNESQEGEGLRKESKKLQLQDIDEEVGLAMFSPIQGG